MRRRVEVLKYERHQYDPVTRRTPPPDKVLEYEAWFESWGLGCTETEQGGVSYSVAIVTRDDGTVETVLPELTRFKPASEDVAAREEHYRLLWSRGGISSSEYAALLAAARRECFGEVGA